ncbi:MAG: toll/interleukin-1 receptor domain-containing protein [Streptomyces sp.]|nr:toll/interleukin-1 receptor domain-containing protein [Streptomyces sp.]
MADIFLSYASADRVKARTLSELFESAGWSVWWDRHTEGGTEWEAALEHELNTARCVLVLWTRQSILSEWVHREARAARARGALLPVLLEPVMAPEELSEVQAVTATAWLGDERSFELRPLLDRLANLLGIAPPSLEKIPVQASAAKLSRIEVAEAVFEFCAARLEFFRSRGTDEGVSESTLEEMRRTYVVLSEVIAPVSSDDLHNLIVKHENAYTP